MIDIDFIIIFVIWNKKMYIMFHFRFKYDGNIIFVRFYMKMSPIIIFLSNFKSVISWYFLSHFFEAVKESHIVQFTIFSNTNIWSYTITIT